MTSEVISEPAGPRFGPYILTAVLGRGGIGVVYRAFDTIKGRTVALKVLIPEFAATTIRPPLRTPSRLATPARYRRRAVGQRPPGPGPDRAARHRVRS